MNKYRVLINGQNFLLATETGQTKFGFYATCFVEGSSQKEAEQRAVDLIRKRNDIQPLNTEDNPPMLFADEIDELNDLEYSQRPKKVGYSFYDEDKE